MSNSSDESMNKKDRTKKKREEKLDKNATGKKWIGVSLLDGYIG